MLKPNPDLWPPSGWTIPVTPTVTLSASSRKELVEKLAYWNTARGLSSDPEEQIDRHICTVYPHICRQFGKSTRAPLPPLHLVARRVEYLNRIYRQIGQQRAVSETEAIQRAAICGECPHRTYVPPGCAPCGDNSVFLRKAIVARFPLVEGALPAACCAVYGTDLPVALRLVSEADPDAPTGCWRHPRRMEADGGPGSRAAVAGSSGGSGPSDDPL